MISAAVLRTALIRHIVMYHFPSMHRTLPVFLCIEPSSKCVTVASRRRPRVMAVCGPEDRLFETCGKSLLPGGLGIHLRHPVAKSLRPLSVLRPASTAGFPGLGSQTNFREPPQAKGNPDRYATARSILVGAAVSAAWKRAPTALIVKTG